MSVIDPQTMRRNFLGAAAAAIALGAFLGFAAVVVKLPNSFDSHRTSEMLAAIFALSAGIVVAAMVIAAAAFLGAATQRSRRLRLAFELTGVAFTLSAVAAGFITYLYATTDSLPGSGTASKAIVAVANVVAGAAAWVAAIAFMRADRSGIADRDKWLGWATAVEAGNLLLICLSAILFVRQKPFG